MVFPQSPSPIYGQTYAPNQVANLNLSSNNTSLTLEIVTNTNLFVAYINQQLQQQNASIGKGGYLENRSVYKRSTHFDGAEPRTLHLGVDLWTAAPTPLYAPLAGTIHSFQDNKGFGNYGPTLILQHQYQNTTYFTLYGHLSRNSLANYAVGDNIKAGHYIGETGQPHENGNWPVHLHFQVITDMLNGFGDFAGVAPLSEQAYWATLCPDPMPLLVIEHPQ